MTYARRCFPGTRPPRTDEGQALVLVVLLLTALLGVAAVAIDIGYARMVRAQAQAAADAAAAAGADVLPSGNAASTATSTATTNGFSSGGAVTVTVNNPPTSGSHQGDSMSVEVIISKRVNTFFAPVLGLSTITATARAVATSKYKAVPCVICVMSPTAAQAFTATGGTVATVSGGNIAVDSTASNAGYLSGSASVTATAVNIVGKTSITGTGAFHPTANTGSSAVADPLSGVPVPSVSGSSNGAICLSHAQTQTISPGIYSSLEAIGTSQLTLQSGVYIITGTASTDPCTGASGHGGVVVSNSASLTANGALIYFACPSYPTACTSGQVGAGFSLTGNGVYSVVAQSSGTYQGLSIFYDRHNAAPLTITNSGHNNFTGTIYALSSAMTVSGGTSTDQIDSIFVANTVTLNGSGTININFQSSYNYQVGHTSGSADLTE